LTNYTRQLQVEQRRASAAQTFLVDLLRSPDPFAPADPERGQEITVVEALDLGVARLEAGAYDDPGLRVSLLNSISSVYASLDRHDSAIELREESLALERKLYGDDSPQVVTSLVMLGEQNQARGDYESAIGHLDEQLEIARRIHEDDDPALGAAEAAKAQIYSLQGLGNRTEGVQLLKSGDLVRDEGLRQGRTRVSESAGHLRIENRAGSRRNDLCPEQPRHDGSAQR
jgi:tetratricopeptide (TPR) repeat protein